MSFAGNAARNDVARQGTARRVFAGKNLRGQSFKGQDLTGADFHNARIQGANFSHANLTRANFSNAKAGAGFWVEVLVMVLLGLSGAMLGLLGNSIADTVNSGYLYYFGPRDATLVFGTLIVFSVFLLWRDLVTAIAGTILSALVVWVGFFLWEYTLTGDIIAALVGQETHTASAIILIDVFWLGFSTIPTLAAILMATVHFQRHRRRIPGRFEMVTVLFALAIAIPGAVAFTGIWAKINAPLDAIVLWGLSLHTTQRIVSNHPRYGWLRSGALALATWGATRFHKAQLSGADFAGARLNATDFTGASLMRTRFAHAQFLDYARVGTTLLNQPRVRQLLVTGQGGLSYEGCNLRGANLVEAQLTGADFTDADLSRADFTGADLMGAYFVRAQAVGTCFRGAQLTESCIEAWNIDSTTQIEGVVCDYVYLLSGQRERRPSQGDFEPGDFTKLFQDVLHTVDLIFRQGLDMSAFMSAFQQVQAYGENVSIRSIENKGDGMVVVKVEVPEDAAKSELQATLTQEYDRALQQVEARYQAAIEAKDEQIMLYRQHQSELSQLTQLLTQSRGPDPLPRLRGKRVVLKLGKAETEGIPVTLQVGDEGALPQIETAGWLPAAEQLLATQKRWQAAYRQVYQQSARLSVPDAQVTNFSYQEMFSGCRGVDQELTVQINDWLNSEQFRPVRDTLLASLDPADSIRFVLQTDNMQIRALPLHLWQWFDRYTRAELILSEPVYRQPLVSASASGQVKVLAILGDSRGLNVMRDRALLEQLPDVALTCLVEPARSQLNDSLWSQPWDILFFAGHSICNERQQRLRINAEESLGLSELSYGLRNAVERGLKLAIFNACDGLQLIQDLSDTLSLPPAIVMRHPIPDAVAQAFLKHFLTAFSQGLPLHQSVREARERLQGLESQFPFATWLPVLCQNPAAPPLTWPMLKGVSRGDHS